jgi:predicted Zn-dependent protease
VNPQAIEPGRYTVILEPQATADLMVGVIEALRRVPAENGNGPFAGRVIGRSKIGEQVLDRRMTLRADPMDPDGGFVPYERFSGAPYQAVAWIDRGILRELAYDRYYALTMLGYDKALPESGSYRLTAAPGVPTIDVDEMIARTERGLLVTRFHGVEVVDSDSVLCTGYTRDGLWLIENGKITRPVKNFRFTESPLFVLNKLLDIGDAVRVFRPGKAWIAPAVRVEDFSFTSLADAV